MSNDSKGPASAALMEVEVALGLWGTPITIEEHVKRLEAEVDRLRTALEKAASTLDDTATDLRLISRIDSC